MFSFFRNLKSRIKRQREKRDMMHTLQQTAILFETLGKFKSAGLIYYDFRQNIVTIAQVLAEHFIYSDKEWQNFLHQCLLWASYQYSVSEYTRIYTKVQADAEAEAYRVKNEQRPESMRQPLTDAERRLARMRAVSRYDSEHPHTPVTPPEIQFVILGAADGKPLAVARQLNGRFETATVPDEDDEAGDDEDSNDDR